MTQNIVKHETDLTVGPIMKKLITYALPIIGVNMLQLVFNAADIAILGMFSTRGDIAVGAVGANSALINLIIGLFIGISIGANVTVARSRGANDIERSHRLVGTSMLSGLIFGVLIMVIGFFMAEQFLIWTSCTAEKLPLATSYLRIYLFGAPIIMLYNFSASILRATGDTLRPFIYLVIGGVLNVGLNIFFILVVGLDVEGVAIATVASQGISALLACISLFKSKGHARFSFKYFRLYKREFADIIKVGVPVGLSKCFFSLSNVTIQSAINALDETIQPGSMTAHAIGHYVDAFANEALHGIALASLSFVSQNIGANKIERVKKTILYSFLLTAVFGVVLGGVSILMAPFISGLMTNDSEIIRLACIRINLVGGTCVLAGAMNVSQELLRGLGKSFLSMCIALLGSCVLRIIYINTLYLLNPSFTMVYIAYPITWTITALAITIAMIPTYKKLKAKMTNRR